MDRKLFIVSLALLALLLGGQSVSAKEEKPFWTNGYFRDAANSYIEVVSAIGWEEADARNKACQEIIKRRSLATGTDAKVVIKGNDISMESDQDLIVKARIIAEHVEHPEPGTYKVYLLVQTAKNPTYTYESVEVTDKYLFSARCLVPGMAQIWKGSKAKGGSMIALEVIGVGGIVASFCMKGSYERLMEEDPKFKQDYSDNADMWQNIGYGCIAFTAAVYVWSFIDGAVAPGKKHIQIGSKSYEYSLAPIASPQGDLGLAMQVKF